MPVIALVLVSEAWADLPFPRFSRRETEIRVRFENLETYLEHDFYVKFGVGGSGPPRFFKLRSSRINSEDRVSLSNDRGINLGPFFLVAVSRGQKMPDLSEVRGKEDWLTTKMPGSLQSEQLRGPDGFLSETEDGWEIDYRVHIDGDTLKVVYVQGRRPFNMAWLLVAGIVLCAGFAIVIIKRRRSKVAATLPAAD